MSITERRRAALSILRPQWRRCLWRKPRGHVRQDNYCCAYCGKPEYVAVSSLFFLEQLAAAAHTHPIAQGLAKSEVA